MKRINWIDELKGFILILVCLGHTHISIPFMGGGRINNLSSFSYVYFFFLIRDFIQYTPIYHYKLLHNE